MFSLTSEFRRFDISEVLIINSYYSLQLKYPHRSSHLFKALSPKYSPEQGQT